MSSTNNFLPFCPTDTGTNLLSQAAYAADPQLTIGNQPGIARSTLVNKVLRQASALAAQVAQLACNITGGNALDDGTSATTLLPLLTSALSPKYPDIRRLTSSTGTYNLCYVFAIASGSATLGATYTNNTITFTVVSTVASALEIRLTGSGAPLSSGTLTKASGTGDATLTFYAVRAPLYLYVKAQGAGGGGGSGGPTGTGLTGTNGGDTTFGSSLITAGGGTGGNRCGAGNSSANYATGGTGTINSPAQIFRNITGGTGGGAGDGHSVSNVYAYGAAGGAGPLGGNGQVACQSQQPGVPGVANTGGGGGGGSANSASGSGRYGGFGGGAGAYVESLIPTPSATYAWVVGAAGVGGVTADTDGSNGANGGSGLIEVLSCYQ